MTFAWLFAACLSAFLSSCLESTSLEESVESSEEQTSLDLALFGTNTFIIKIEGCKSQYQATVTELKSTLNLYKNDQGCLAKLTEFTRNGLHFTAVPGKGFTTWLAGEQAEFKSDDGLTLVKMKVEQQISSPVASNDAVRYSIAESVEGNQKVGILRTIFGASGRSTKNTAINFDVVGSYLLGMNTANGSAQFIFGLECRAAIVGSGTSNAECSGIRMRNLKYVLIKDTVTGTPCPNSPDDCDSYFSSGSRSVEVEDIQALGSDILPHGGFLTKTRPAEVLNSPAQVSSNPNMILLLSDGNSIQWFRLSLEVKAVLYLDTL